jgi:hypothetical protein
MMTFEQEWLKYKNATGIPDPLALPVKRAFIAGAMVSYVKILEASTTKGESGEKIKAIEDELFATAQALIPSPSRNHGGLSCMARNSN